MEQIDPDLIDSAGTLLNEITGFLEGLILPWRIYQLAIIAGLFVLAHGFRWWAAPRLRDWLRMRQGWPRWRLRLAALVLRRLRGIAFVVLIWLVLAAMREYTWPSRSYLLGIAATLATAWLFVGLAARLVRNRTLGAALRWAGSIWVTLHVLGLTGTVAEFLDSAAITLGSYRLSLLGLLKAVTVTVLLFLVARAVSEAAARRIGASRDLSPSIRVLSVKLLQAALYGGVVLFALTAMGFDLTSLAVLSGAIGLGLGFGLQKVVSNLISGVILLLDKSIKPGDVISLGDTFGWINALGARYVSVLTRDGREFLIPNEDLITSQVVNWSHSNEFVRLDIHFGTAYDADPHEVRRIAVEAAKTVGRVLTDRAPVCHVTGFGDSSVDYILRFWITDPTQGLTNVRGAVFLALWDALKAAGIAIPFPQREVRLLPGSTVNVPDSAD